MSTAPADLVRLVNDLAEYEEATRGAYDAVHFARERRWTHPIPFFGSLPDADILTVGLNPSSNEFAEGRWPTAALPPDALTDRLIHYFDGPDASARLPAPDPWFTPWIDALGDHLGASYRAGARFRAAHLDLTPRTTRSAQAVRKSKAMMPVFKHMLAADIPWAMRFIVAAPRVRLVLLAGTSPHAYLDNALRGTLRLLPDGAWRIVEDPAYRDDEGDAKKNAHVRRHTLTIAGRGLPVWYCSSSPSDDDRPGLLNRRLGKNAHDLLQHLA